MIDSSKVNEWLVNIDQQLTGIIVINKSFNAW